MFDEKFCKPLPGASPNLRDLTMLAQNVIATNADHLLGRIGETQGTESDNSGCFAASVFFGNITIAYNFCKISVSGLKTSDPVL